MFKSVSWCGKLSGFFGVVSVSLGVHLLYEELKANTFVLHQSIAVAFICLGIFFLFHLSVKVLESRYSNLNCGTCIRSSLEEKV